MSEPVQIIVESSPQAAAAKAAELCRQVVAAAVQQREVCNLALSGGTTPRPMYHQLAEHALLDKVPWPQVEVFFGDERDVPHDNVESNFHMAQRVMLDHMPIDSVRVHPMRTDTGDPQSAADEYEQILREKVPPQNGDPPSFDLILLGIGGDGHTASLFPGSDVLDVTDRLVVSTPVRILGRNRMTFTFPLINAARHVLMFVTGDDKADIVRRVLIEKDRNLPAARIAPTHGTMQLVLDQAAARLL